VESKTTGGPLPSKKPLLSENLLEGVGVIQNTYMRRGRGSGVAQKQGDLERPVEKSV